MIYKTQKHLKVIYTFLNDITKYLKNKGKVEVYGSFIRQENKYITDIDLRMKMNKNDPNDYLFSILNFIENYKKKKVIFENLKINKVDEEFLSKNDLVFKNEKVNGDLKLNKEDYRYWNIEELSLGIKMDHVNNFVFLDSLLSQVVSVQNDAFVINFFLQIDKNIYIPLSINLYKVKNIFKSFDKYFSNEDYIHIYKRINTHANIILKKYDIEEVETNNLLKLINDYKEKILNINLLSSVQTQFELVGKIDNYKIDISELIKNLYKLIDNSEEYKDIKKKIYKLKKGKESYILKIDICKKIIDELFVIINKKLKPTVEKELSNIQQLMKKYEITYGDEKSKKTKKVIKKVVKATKKK